jgi:hypothetical protein
MMNPFPRRSAALAVLLPLCVLALPSSRAQAARTLSPVVQARLRTSAEAWSAGKGHLFGPAVVHMTDAHTAKTTRVDLERPGQLFETQLHIDRQTGLVKAMRHVQVLTGSEIAGHTAAGKAIRARQMLAFMRAHADTGRPILNADLTLALRLIPQSELGPLRARMIKVALKGEREFIRLGEPMVAAEWAGVRAALQARHF